MLHKIDYVGNWFTDIEEAIKTYQGLGFKLTRRDRIDSQKVETAFFQIGESCIELIAATERKFNRKIYPKNAGKGGLTISDHGHQYRDRADRLRQGGYTLINETPVAGAHGTKVAFVHRRYRRRIAGVV